MGYSLDFSVVLDALPAPLLGCAATIGLAVAGMVLAMVIGVLGVAARSSGLRPIVVVTVTFVEIIRNTPFLVQVFFIYFALPAIGLTLNPTVTAIIALGLNGGAYAIEIIRGGVQSIHKGQVEAGLALGLHRVAVFRLIVIKPALRAVYPSLTGQFILLTLTSSICSSIAAYELTSVAARIDAETFRSFEVYFTVTALYGNYPVDVARARCSVSERDRPGEVAVKGRRAVEALARELYYWSERYDPAEEPERWDVLTASE